MALAHMVPLKWVPCKHVKYCGQNSDGQQTINSSGPLWKPNDSVPLLTPEVVKVDLL